MNVTEFLGLERRCADDRWQMQVKRAHCGGRDSIYGGCGLAAAIEAAEACTGRPAFWASCQFLRAAHLDRQLDLRVYIGSSGRAVTHARVIASVADAEVFVTLISLGERSFPASGTWNRMPDVPGPDGLPPRYILASNKGGVRELIDERAVTDDPCGIMRNPDGRAAVWVRLPGGIPAKASALAIIGDEVSTGTSAVIEPDMQAPSVDNTIRIVSPQACEWILADIDLHAAARGFAHGTVNLWSQQGQLLAIASQTGALRLRGT